MNERIYESGPGIEKNPVINFLFNERLRRILHMIDFSVEEKSIILDLGCNRGYLSQVLSLKSITIGLDCNKSHLIEAKRLYHHIDFIHSDISFLPFRNDSFDVVICASVLEHIKNLNSAVKQIKDIIKKGGMLIAGYPVEKKFLKTMMRLFTPKHERYINPNAFFGKKFWTVPVTHKQDFLTIRDALTKHFLLIKKDKIPLKIFPDSISIYECIKMLKH